VPGTFSGWLVQSSTDTNPIQSPAAQRRV